MAGTDHTVTPPVTDIICSAFKVYRHNRNLVQVPLPALRGIKTIQCRIPEAIRSELFPLTSVLYSPVALWTIAPIRA